MYEQFGFPVVDAENIYEVLADFGIRPWELIEGPMNLDEYRTGKLTEDEQGDLRFAPKGEMILFEQPNGRSFRAFRSVGKNWATVFALFPGDLLLVVGEWKHGANVVSLVPPSGVPRNGETMTETAKREFEDETGARLSVITPLSSLEGIPVSSRQTTQRYFPFLGTVAEPVDRGPSSLDDTEYLAAVLIPLDEWLKLIERGQVLEDCAVSITFLALRKMGRLQLIG